MKLEILSFDGKSFRADEVVSLTTMTSGGEITVLSNHAPLLTSLVPWVLSVVYTNQDRVTIRDTYAIGKGMLEVAHNEVKILLDALVSSKNVNVEEAEKAKQRALELMEKYKDSKDKVDMEKFIDAEDQLLKSIAQLKLWNLK